jgi:hypothetical protein
VVRARVLADAGASKSTGNNRHKSPTPNTLSGRTHPPASLVPVGLVSHQTHSEQWVGTTSRGPTGGRVPSWGNLITN